MLVMNQTVPEVNLISILHKEQAEQNTFYSYALLLHIYMCLVKID